MGRRGWVFCALLAAGCGSRVEVGAGAGGGAGGVEVVGGAPLGGAPLGGGSLGGGSLGGGGAGGGEPPLWEDAAAAPFECGEHTATSLDATHVLIVGECSTEAQAVTAAVYAYEERAFQLVALDAPLEAIRWHAAIALGGGRAALVLSDGSTRTFSLASGFQAGPSLAVARAQPSLVAEGDAVRIVGGETIGALLTETEIVDFAKGSVVAAPSLLVGRLGAATVRLADGSILVLGGADEAVPAERAASFAGPFEGIENVAGLASGTAALPLGGGGALATDTYATARYDGAFGPRLEHEVTFAPAIALGSGRIYVAGTGLWSGDLRVERATASGALELYATRDAAGEGTSLTAVGDHHLLVLSRDAHLLRLID
ncbi:MAG: hypothetical protein U0271_09025 [Polyangiaceae bacterium]